MLFATLLTSTSFVACSSDDCNENENGNGNGNVSSVENPLQKEGKLLLSGITGNYSGYDYTLGFEYDDKLRPTGCYELEDGEYDYEFKIDYDKGTMEWDNDILDVSFNDKGYITKQKGEYTEVEDDITYYYKTESNYTYDKEGHPIKAISKWDCKYEGSDIYGTDVETSTTELAWANGNLISFTTTDVVQQNHNGEVENATYKNSDTFTYGNQPNKFKQCIEIIDEEGGTLISGLFGVFSEKLPETIIVSYKRTSDKYGEYSEYDEYKGSFTLNPDGSINTETWTETDGTPFASFTFHYTSIDQNTPKSKSYVPQYVPTRASSANKIKEKIRSLKNLPFMPKKEKQTNQVPEVKRYDKITHRKLNSSAKPASNHRTGWQNSL